MTRLHEHVHTDLALEPTFDFVADFENAQAWDPGVAWARRVEPTEGPIDIGTTWELGVRMGGRVAPMTYRIETFERPGRVVLVGAGSGVDAIDDIRFERDAGGGTTIDYTADIRLRGWRGLLQPFLGRTFKRIGRKAADGMARTLASIITPAEPGSGAR